MTEIMTGTPAAVTVSLLTRMLVEAFEGPRGPWTYFTDASPGTGLFATIRGLSAVQVSERGGPGRSTIAGHIHHVSSSLVLSTRALRGEQASRDRARSWTVATVDQAGWAELQARLRREYESLFVAVEGHTVWDEDALGVVLGRDRARGLPSWCYPAAPRAAAIEQLADAGPILLEFVPPKRPQLAFLTILIPLPSRRLAVQFGAVYGERDIDVAPRSV